MKHFLLLAALWAGMAALVSAETVDRARLLEAWRRASEAYRQGNFAEARRGFEALSQAGFRHPDLFYNLGNAYYREGRIGRAVWMFEKALRMQPRHDDARRNLELIRPGLDIEATSASSFLILPFVWVYRLLSVEEWVVATAVSAWVAALCGAVALLARASPTRRLAGRISLVGAALALLCAFFMAPRVYFADTSNWSIVLDQGAVVRDAPSPSAEAYFETTEGERLHAWPAPARGWMKVKRPVDGRTGYLPESALGRV